MFVATKPLLSFQKGGRQKTPSIASQTCKSFSTMTVQLLFFTLIIFFIPGDLHAHAVPYDHSFTHECLVKPLEPHYGGGIAVNPDPKQSEGLKSWIEVGNAQVELGQKNEDSDNYIVPARFGNQDSATLKFQLEEDKLYAFSAWVQASQGNSYVQAVFRTNTGNVTAGWVAAQEGCWSMLKGGLVVNVSGLAELYFKRDNSSTAEIWAASISLQPFTHEEWKSHQDQSIEKVRKGQIKFIVLNKNGQSISNATVFIKQTRPQFPLGCAMNSYTVTNDAYRKWFTSRFKYCSVFENEFRWPYIAMNQTYNDYTTLDSLFNFTKSHGLSVRGHPVHTSSRGAQPGWLNNSTINEPESFQALVNSRTSSLVERYAGQVLHWDVVNENLHDDFFDAVLGKNASTVQYQMVHEIDSKTPLFLNEFYTIEDSEDEVASPWKYLQKVWQIRGEGYHGPLGIGVAGRFSGMNLPYVRASLDVLESAKLPIWITELLVSEEAGINQADYLEQIIRELHAHRAVEGIMIWAAKWASGRCWKMCLTDNNFVNLDTGDVVDKIMAEWTYASGLRGVTNVDGYFESSLFYGEYEVQVSHRTFQTSTNSKFKLAPSGDADAAHHTPLVIEIRI